MGNEQSAEEGVVANTLEVPDPGRKGGGIDLSKDPETNHTNGDSTTASSPRRSSAGAAPVQPTDDAPPIPSGKTKAKAKPKNKPSAADAGGKAPNLNEKQRKSEKAVGEVSDPTAPTQEAGMARYMTLTGLQELFSSYGFGAQQASQEGASENNQELQTSKETAGQEVGGNEKGTSTGAGTDGVSQYLTSTFEEMSDMLQKASADAREGAAALYEKAKIEAAHAREVATAAASNMASQTGGTDSGTTAESKNLAAHASEAESAIPFSRYFTLGGVSEMFRSDSNLFGGESTSSASAAIGGSAAHAEQVGNASPSGLEATADSGSIPAGDIPCDPKAEALDGNELAGSTKRVAETSEPLGAMTQSLKPNTEVVQSKSEESGAKGEAGKAKSEADQVKNEVSKVNKEASQAKSETTQAKNEATQPKSKAAQPRSKAAQSRGKANQTQNEAAQSKTANPTTEAQRGART